MVNGLNQPVMWDEAEKRYAVEDVGFAPIFAHKEIVEVMAEVRRAEEVRGNR